MSQNLPAKQERTKGELLSLMKSAPEHWQQQDLAKNKATLAIEMQAQWSEGGWFEWSRADKDMRDFYVVRAIETLGVYPLAEVRRACEQLREEKQRNWFDRVAIRARIHELRAKALRYAALDPEPEPPKKDVVTPERAAEIAAELGFKGWKPKKMKGTEE